MTLDELMELYNQARGGGGSGVPSTGTDWTSLLPGGGQAPMPTGVSGNYSQVQNALQGGAFNSVGGTQNLQTGSSGQIQSQEMSGTQTGSQTGTQAQQQVGGQEQTGTQTQTGTTNTTGTTQDVTSGRDTQNVNQTTTQGAVDTLGFGQLLRGQAADAGHNDAQRSAFLRDVMQTGGTGFNSQVDQAIRQSLTGPQTTTAGESARARMGGYAAAQVGRNNMDQRLQAAQQLTGPTGLATLSTAANPFVGSTSTTSGTNTTDTNRTSSGQQSTAQNQASTNVSNSTGTNFSNLLGQTAGTSTQETGQKNYTGSTGWQNALQLGSEQQAGSTAAGSSQAGAGNIPQGAPVKAGGCVLCTAAIGLGYERNVRVLRKVIAYKLGPGWKSFRLAARGYFAVFGPFADYLLDHPKLAKFLYPLAKKVVYEELRVSGRSLPFRLDAWLVHWVGDAFCRLAGLFPVAGFVKQDRIINLARRNNILFEVKP